MDVPMVSEPGLIPDIMGLAVAKRFFEIQRFLAGLSIFPV